MVNNPLCHGGTFHAGMLTSHDFCSRTIAIAMLVHASEIRQTHQLRLVVYPTIYKVLHIPRRCRISETSTVMFLLKFKLAI